MKKNINRVFTKPASQESHLQCTSPAKINPSSLLNNNCYLPHYRRFLVLDGAVLKISDPHGLTERPTDIQYKEKIKNSSHRKKKFLRCSMADKEDDITSLFELTIQTISTNKKRPRPF